MSDMEGVFHRLPVCMQPLLLDVRHLTSQSIPGAGPPTGFKSIGEGRQGTSIRLASTSSAVAHRDVIMDMASAANSASLLGKDAGTETGATRPSPAHDNGTSSLPSSGSPHAQNGPPTNRPEQNGSALSCEGNPAETWVLQIQKVYAKPAKDALKALGLLDRRRKVPASDRSDAEVALPVTPSGAAFLNTCTMSLANRQNGAYRTDSASGAVLECSSSLSGLSHEDAKAGIIAETRAGDTLAQQVNLKELEQLIAQRVAWVQRKQAIQRSGRATPANALLHAVLSMLASKGLPATDCLCGDSSPFCCA